jgi:hypothetical protein
LEAGLSEIVVRLGDDSEYYQWTYSDYAPFGLDVPTEGFSPGVHNLTAIISRDSCEPLTLIKEVEILVPNPTYVDSLPSIDAYTSESVCIHWSLHFSQNGTAIYNQTVSLTISDSLANPVYIVQDNSGAFSWTPSSGGVYSFTIDFSGNGSLLESSFSGSMTVLENTTLQWLTNDLYDQYSSVNLSVKLATLTGMPLSGEDVAVTVTGPTGYLLIDAFLETDDNGIATIELSLDKNGPYVLDASFLGDAIFLSSEANTNFVAWSSTDLLQCGIPAEGLVDNEYRVVAQLLDSGDSPVSDKIVRITIYYHPSTIVYQQNKTTNSTGHVQIFWDGQTAGEYEIAIQFAGTLSYGSSSVFRPFQLRIPLYLDFLEIPSLLVGELVTLDISALDQQAHSISDVNVTLVIEVPDGGEVWRSFENSVQGIASFEWTVSVRGPLTLTASTSCEYWYESASCSIDDEAFDETAFMFSVEDDIAAPCQAILAITVTGGLGQPLAGLNVTLNALLDGVSLGQWLSVTDAQGQMGLALNIPNPGVLSVSTTTELQDWILESQCGFTQFVFGATALDVTYPGLPVLQGSDVAIVAHLTDWSGMDLQGQGVVFVVRSTQGTVLRETTRTTGSDGRCSIILHCDTVGDLTVNMSYAGTSVNAAIHSIITQRVYTTPVMLLETEPSVILGESLVLSVGIQDDLAQPIAGRTLLVQILRNSTIEFEAQVQSAEHLVPVSYSSSERGQVTIRIFHAGDQFYYANDTSQAVSCLQMLSGTLKSEYTVIDVLSQTRLTYLLQSEENLEGISIVFTVFGPDLIPVWDNTTQVNATGTSSTAYTADDVRGVLTVRAEPAEDQYLVGGTSQVQFTVTTYLSISATYSPDPPRAGDPLEVNLSVDDDFGQGVSGLSLTILAFDPSGLPVKLGTFSNSISLPISDGSGAFEFRPSGTGLYSLEFSCSGNSLFHQVYEQTQVIVYSLTELTMVRCDTDLEVGGSLTLVARLSDYLERSLTEKTVRLYLDGPGSNGIGPLLLITNASGHITWTGTVSEEGSWSVDLSFEGIGVYLPASVSQVADVRYGTVLECSVRTQDQPVADNNPLVVEVLLTDSGGESLEGFTVEYAVYHDEYGIIIQDSIIQQSENASSIEILFERGGPHTIVFTFLGTDHYHPTSSGIEVFVKGITRIEILGSVIVDRSQNASIDIALRDETDELLVDIWNLSALCLNDDIGEIPIDSRIHEEDGHLLLGTMALSPGSYHLTVEVSESSVRLGDIESFAFNITTSTSFVLNASSVTPAVGAAQHFTLFLMDSLNESITSRVIELSIYSPDGREIYGSPLSDMTRLETTVNGLSVSWTPQTAGVYLADCVFIGDDYILSSSHEARFIFRYPVEMQVSYVNTSTYGQEIRLTALLAAGVGKMAETPLELLIDGEPYQTENLLTNSRGAAEITLEGLLAGRHTVYVSYNGSETHLPASYRGNLEIHALSFIEIKEITGLYTKQNCTIFLETRVLGVSSDWIGTLTVTIKSNGSHKQVVHTSIRSYEAVSVSFFTEVPGLYSVICNLEYLPLSESRSRTFEIQIAAAPFYSQMDVTVAPLAAGGILIVAIGVIMRKRFFSKIVPELTEWN